MTEQERPPDATEDATALRPSAPQPGRSPSAAAAAASRARRIGGRPVQRPADPDRADPDRADPDSADPDSADPASPRPRPASPDVADKPAAADRESRVVLAVPSWLRWLPAGVLTAGVITMAVLLVVLSHGVWWAQTSSGSARDRVLAAAKTCLIRVNTYKYTALDSYQRSALACTTGTLTADLTKAIQTIVRPRAPMLKASQTVQVNGAGIESVSGSHWTILIFAQVAVKSTTYPSGTQAPLVAEVDMAQVGGRWLMARETTLGGTGTGTGAASGGAAAPSGSATASPPAGGTGGRATVTSPGTSPVTSPVTSPTATP